MENSREEIAKALLKISGEIDKDVTNFIITSVGNQIKAYTELGELTGNSKMFRYIVSDCLIRINVDTSINYNRTLDKVCVNYCVSLEDNTGLSINLLTFKPLAIFNDKSLYYKEISSVFSNAKEKLKLSVTAILAKLIVRGV